MCPFTPRKNLLPAPSFVAGEISIHWNREFGGGELDYSLSENPEFDVAILNKLVTIKRWISELDKEIESHIERHLDGWCEWNGEKEIVCVDVSRLLDRNEVDVAYAGGEEWGDLGINIIISDGSIIDSYAGD